MVEAALEQAQLALLRQLGRDQAALLAGASTFLGPSICDSGLFAVSPVSAAVQVRLALASLHECACTRHSRGIACTFSPVRSWFCVCSGQQS